MNAEDLKVFYRISFECSLLNTLDFELVEMHLGPVSGGSCLLNM